MGESLYIFVEIGAGFAAIITFMFAFLTIVRRWVLQRIYRDIELHQAKRGDSADGSAHQARDEAERARRAAKRARRAAAEARDAACQASQAVQAAHDHIRAVADRGTQRESPTPQERRRLFTGHLISVDKDRELISMTTLFMFDDVDVFLMPADAYAYAGYLDGPYANFAQVKAAHPEAHLIGIATRASDDADALDVEPGDATIPQAPDWVKRQHARGIERPIIYVSAANAQSMIQTLTAADIHRPSYRLWSAHYGAGQHICGPASCGYPQADGTQFTSKALGESLDESLVAADFFGPQPLTFPITQGDAGTEVVTLQKMLNAWASVIGLTPVLMPDGNFGAKTAAAVRLAQKRLTLTPTGECDHTLWTDLSGTPTQRPVPGAPLTAPSPVAVTNKGSEVTFSWPPVGGAAEYQVDITGTNNEVIGGRTVTAATAIVGVSGHPTFLWKMRAGNAHGWGPWGQASSYTLK